MAKTLNEILKMPAEDVASMGAKGKEFVLMHKNNIVQAQKVIKLTFA